MNSFQAQAGAIQGPAPNQQHLRQFSERIAGIHNTMDVHVHELEALGDRLFGCIPKEVGPDKESATPVGDLTAISVVLEYVESTLARLDYAKQRLLEL